jgi:hypothetical protein
VGAGVAAGVGTGVGAHVTCTAGTGRLMEGGAMLTFAALASSTIVVATFCMNVAPALAFTAFWTAAISTLAAAVDASAMGTTVKMSSTPDPNCTTTRSAI